MGEREKLVEPSGSLERKFGESEEKRIKGWRDLVVRLYGLKEKQGEGSKIKSEGKV